MIKQYIYRGLQFQFEEAEAPEGAVEVKAEKAAATEAAPDVKVYKPANKARRTAKK